VVAAVRCTGDDRCGRICFGNRKISLSAVFAGHVNNGRGQGGVFAKLANIKEGDYITVSNPSGRSIVYRVSVVREYQKDAPTDEIFSRLVPSQLALITCDGDWVPSARTFEKRLVVFANPVF